MPVTNLSDIRDLLLPGLNKVFGMYPQIPTQWSDIFQTSKSEMNNETDVEMRYLGLAQRKNEGAALEYDDMGEGFKFVYNHITVALGAIITEEALEDNLYKSQFNPTATSLRNSFAQTKEVLGASILNLSTASGTTYGDGQPLLSANHPYGGGVYANTPAVPTDLNEQSLQDAYVAIRGFRDLAGLKIMSRPAKLFVTPSNKFQASRLLESELRVGTSNNDINALRDDFKSYVVLDYLTNTRSWFVTTTVDNALRFFQRRPFSSDMQVDFSTKSLAIAGTERYSFGISNPRGIYGSFPT